MSRVCGSLCVRGALEDSRRGLTLMAQAGEPAGNLEEAWHWDTLSVHGFGDTHRDADVSIAFEGAIYNRVALLGELGVDASLGDAALVLELFRRWGQACFEKISGDFVIVVWEPRERRLRLITDALGLSSLLYSRTRAGLVFGSEPAQLVAHPQVSKQPDLEVVASYLAADITSEHRTLYEALRRVRPGHVLEVRDGSSSMTPYLDYSSIAPQPYDASIDYSEALRELLATVLAEQTAGQERSAMHLSGGLASSSLVSLAAHQGAALQTYSLSFPGQPCDEMSFVRDVLERHPVPNTMLDATMVPEVDLLEQAGRYCDVPDFPNTSMHALLCEQIRGDGFRHFITGEGGDELWGGNFAHAADLLRAGRVRDAWRRSCSDSAVESYAVPSFAFLRYAVSPNLPAKLREGLDSLRQLRRSTKGWLGPALGSLERPPTYRWKCQSHSQSELLADLYGGWSSQGTESGMRFLRSFGLRRRAPLLDLRLVRLALSMPDAAKRQGELAKSVLRESMRGVLPERVRLRRDKSDYGVTFETTLRSQAQRFAHLEIEALNWVGPGARAHFQAFRRGNPAGLMNVWMLIAIESWYRSVLA